MVCEDGRSHIRGYVEPSELNGDDELSGGQKRKVVMF